MIVAVPDVTALVHVASAPNWEKTSAIAALSSEQIDFPDVKFVMVGGGPTLMVCVIVPMHPSCENDSTVTS